MPRAPTTPEHETLPYRPGESPFRVKGVFYRGSVEYIERTVPGGVRAVLGAIQGEALRGFLEQPFVAATFYDVFPLVALGYPSASLCGQPIDRFLRHRSRFQAEQQATTVYRSLLSLTSSAAIATKLPLLASQLYNFGTTEVEQTGPSTVEVRRGGLPVELLPWYVPGTESYLVTALRLSGAINPRVTSSAFRPDKKEHGLMTGALTHWLSWQPPAASRRP